MNPQSKEKRKKPGSDHVSCRHRTCSPSSSVVCVAVRTLDTSRLQDRSRPDVCPGICGRENMAGTSTKGSAHIRILSCITDYSAPISQKSIRRAETSPYSSLFQTRALLQAWSSALEWLDELWALGGASHCRTQAGKEFTSEGLITLAILLTAPCHC